MRQYKESEWREEVKAIKAVMRSDSSKSPESTPWWGIGNATTREAALYFYFSLPSSFNTDPDNILSLRIRLKEIRRKRRYLLRRSLKAKIYRWQFKCEYKRIMRHNKPNNTIEQ